MKILYHHRTLGDGAEGIHIREMVSAFRQLGHTVRMVGPAAGRDEPASEKQQARFSILKQLIRGPAYECMELGYNFMGYATLRQAIREFKPDFIYDRYITYNYSAVGIGRQLQIPVFMEVNAPLAYERAVESDEKLYFKGLSRWFEKHICTRSFKTITVSTPLKDYLVSLGVPPDHIQVMPNGVNLDTFKPVGKSKKVMAQYGLTPQHLVVGFTGILRPWHGVDLLVKAFIKLHKRFPRAVLLLVGDGTIRLEIEKMAQRAGCQHAVIITGRVPHQSVFDHISVFDMAVSPKTTFYASPMKIPEYMAMKKPVIAPDTPNIHDLIENGRTGLLFKKEDSESLYHTMASLAVDSAKRDRLAADGCRVVETRLNWPAIARRIVDMSLCR